MLSGLQAGPAAAGVTNTGRPNVIPGSEDDDGGGCDPMRGAARSDGRNSSGGGGGDPTTMCIDTWTRVRHWSAPERVPVVAAAEAADMADKKLDPFCRVVDDDQLDLFSSSDLKMRLSGGLAASLEAVTYKAAAAAPAFTWAREVTGRRRRLRADALGGAREEEPLPDDAGSERDNERLPTTTAAAPMVAPVVGENSRIGDSCLVGGGGDDLAMLESVLPADKARPCPMWKRRKKKKECEPAGSSEVNVLLRDQSPLVPEVLCPPKPEPLSGCCRVPLSNCNCQVAVSEKSSYEAKGRPPRSGGTCSAAALSAPVSRAAPGARVNWATVLSLVAVACCVLAAPCAAKICPSVQLKENVSEWRELLGGCTVIEGSLIITTGESGCTVVSHYIFFTVIWMIRLLPNSARASVKLPELAQHHGDKAELLDQQYCVTRF